MLMSVFQVCSETIFPYWPLRVTPFVSKGSVTAPIASGWSKSRRVGLSPTGKSPPLHGARHNWTFNMSTYKAI